MKNGHGIPLRLLPWLLAVALISAVNLGCSAQKKDKAATKPGPMLDQGTIDLDTPDFTLSLVRSSQTVAALKPKGADGFDFTPGDLLDRAIQGRLLSPGRPRVAAAVREFRRLEELFDRRRPQTCDCESGICGHAGCRRPYSHATFRLPAADHARLGAGRGKAGSAVCTEKQIVRDHPDWVRWAFP